MKMLRYIFGVLIFGSLAFSASFTFPDFRQCYNKNVQSFVYFGDIRAVAVDKYHAVAYSDTTPTAPYVKYDPFLNLYLFKSNKPLNPVRLKSTHALKLGEWIAGMDDDSLYAGNFAKSGDLLDSFYLHNAQMEANSIISCLCCEVYGLGIGAGTFIGSEYITRFIKQKDVYYGDVGVRFAKKANGFFVNAIDPFSQNSGFMLGDQIRKLNGKKISTLKQLNQAVLFAKPGSIIDFELMRDKALVALEAKVFAREGGGYLSDAFLEKKGIFFDDNLAIKHINKESFGDINGLKIGDRLMQVDDMKIANEDDLRHYLSVTQKSQVQLLFDRNDFQFFVKLVLK